ncbi:MAG: EAL domain-containing protein [Woeseiaceae bacterium]|nr:EAL domain-containing protein [Woeseiaceae bacterium]
MYDTSTTTIRNASKRWTRPAFRLAIDDFGTGYSALSYLKHLPIRILKIDRSFIRDLPDDEDDAALTIAVLTMARGLGITVVAEGVETGAQLEFLRQQGCRCVQGFLLSRPLPPAELEALLRDPAFPASRLDAPETDRG